MGKSPREGKATVWRFLVRFRLSGSFHAHSVAGTGLFAFFLALFFLFKNLNISTTIKKKMTWQRNRKLRVLFLGANRKPQIRGSAKDQG